WSTGSSVGAASAISVRKGGMGMTLPPSGGSSVGFSSVGSRFLSSSDSPKSTAFETIGVELWATAASGITTSHRPSAAHRLHANGERRRIGIVHLLRLWSSTDEKTPTLRRAAGALSGYTSPLLSMVSHDTKLEPPMRLQSAGSPGAGGEGGLLRLALLFRHPQAQDAAGPLEGDGTGGLHQRRQRLRAAREPLQDVDAEGPVLVEEIDPAHRLPLAQERETAVPALPAQLVERIAAEERADRRRQQRGRALAEEAGGDIAPFRPLAEPPQPEGLAALRRRRRLHLPGAGDVRLGGGGRLVLLLEEPQEFLGEGVAGRGGRILVITHGALLCGVGARTRVTARSGPQFF